MMDDLGLLTRGYITSGTGSGIPVTEITVTLEADELEVDVVVDTAVTATVVVCE